jgi:hypothetical protein
MCSQNLLFIFQLLNPSVDAPVSRLLQHIQSSLEEDDSMKSQFQIIFKTNEETDSTSCQLSINSELARFPFVWKFYAMEAEKEMVRSYSVLNGSMEVVLIVIIIIMSRSHAAIGATLHY